MLTGEYKHNLDAKNRLFIPAKHRETLGEEFVVAISVRDHCLKVYSMDYWNAYIATIDKMDRKESEIALRTLHKSAENVTPDAQGRIVLSPKLIKFANIQKGAVVVGCGKYAEIWAEEAYTIMEEEEDMEALRAMLESYGL